MKSTSLQIFDHLIIVTMHLPFSNILFPQIHPWKLLLAISKIEVKCFQYFIDLLPDMIWPFSTKDWLSLILGRQRAEYSYTCCGRIKSTYWNRSPKPPAKPDDIFNSAAPSSCLCKWSMQICFDMALDSNIHCSPAWPPRDRTSALGRWLKRDPEKKHLTSVLFFCNYYNFSLKKSFIFILCVCVNTFMHVRVYLCLEAMARRHQIP